MVAVLSEHIHAKLCQRRNKESVLIMKARQQPVRTEVVKKDIFSTLTSLRGPGWILELTERYTKGSPDINGEHVR